MKQLFLLSVIPLTLIACAGPDETSSAEELVSCGDPSPVSSIQPAGPAARVPGESFSFAFAGPGEFEYTCALHPQQMGGVIEVSAP